MDIRHAKILHNIVRYPIILIIIPIQVVRYILKVLYKFFIGVSNKWAIFIDNHFIDNK